jgi:RNA polymerase sigma factor (sigma-70 family)
LGSFALMSSLSHMTDQELLDHYYSDGNTRWLGLLLSRYTLLLFGVSMKYLKNEEEAKDAVQFVFLKALTEIPKYKVTYFKSWIYMIAKNHCLMLLRNKGLVKSLEDHHHLLKDEGQDLITLAEKESMLARMDEAVNELNHEQRTCINMFYLQKLSYQEIAENTGYTLLQVKSYIQNGKRNLKITLQKRPEHEG